MPGRFSFTDENGAAVAFQRTLLVKGLTAGTTNPLAARIDEARTAVDAAGFAIGATTSLDSNLRVVKQEFESAGDSYTGSMICTVTYAAVADTIPLEGNWIPTLTGTLNQIQTAKDVLGFPISLSHTFPNDDPNHPGETITQGAKVNQFRPLSEITYVGRLKVPSIFQEKIKYLGKTNSTTWNYGGPGRWLCTGFNASLLDRSTTPYTWKVEVTFQADGYLWQQEAVFIDPATGREPDGLVPGVGIKKVITQYSVDFNDLIPAS
jgi:hypothetical protein